MREEDIQLGGGNVWAILTSGILMFLFYALGWGYMGTFALFVFIFIGIKSLFPIIAAFWGLLILCIYHFPEPIAIIAVIFWIVVLTTIEIAARTGCFDEGEGKNKNISDKKVIPDQGLSFEKTRTSWYINTRKPKGCTLMTKTILFLSVLLLSVTAFCTERETIRDAHGKVVGTATTDGNKTVYRDAHGKVTGTATTSGNKTTYRDATGKAVGTATESGNRTTYRDATGKTIGTATESGNKTTYRDATGKTSGTATSSGSGTTYRDATGKTVGTKK